MKTLLKILTIVILPLALLGFILFNNARSDAELPILEVDNEAYNRHLKGGDIFSSMADDPSDRLRDSLTCYLDRTQIFADEGKIDQNTVATPHYQSLINGFAKVVLNRADRLLRTEDGWSSDRHRKIRENLNTIERQRQSYGVSLDQSEASRYNSVHTALNLYDRALGRISAARSNYINQLEDYPSKLAPISSCISDSEANEYVKASGVISSLKDVKSNLQRDYKNKVARRCDDLLNSMKDPKYWHNLLREWTKNSEQVSKNRTLHEDIVDLVNTYRIATEDTSLDHFTTDRQDWWTYDETNTISLDLINHANNVIGDSKKDIGLNNYPEKLATIRKCISDCVSDSHVNGISNLIGQLEGAQKRMIRDYRKKVTSRCNTLLDHMIDPKVIYDERWKTWRNDSERVSENKKLHNEIVSLVNTYRKATGDTSLNHFTTERQDWWTY